MRPYSRAADRDNKKPLLDRKAKFLFHVATLRLCLRLSFGIAKRMQVDPMP
jgi:hypothetical protein